jgi:hypothetical protein
MAAEEEPTRAYPSLDESGTEGSGVESIGGEATLGVGYTGCVYGEGGI